MSAGSRESLLKKRPLRTETVRVPVDFPDPDIAGSVYTIKAMTARERTVYEKQFTTKNGKPSTKQDEIRARLLIATLIDPETQKPLLTDADVPDLMAQDVGLIDLLVNAAFRVNSMTSDDIEELAKN